MLFFMKINVIVFLKCDFTMVFKGGKSSRFNHEPFFLYEGRGGGGGVDSIIITLSLSCARLILIPVTRAAMSILTDA